MPGQGQNPAFIYNNDHRAAWQQGIPPYMDERFVGQQIPAMPPGPPAFQGNQGIQGYRPPNWGPNNYNYQYYNYAPRSNWSPRGYHHSSGQGGSRSSGSSRGNASRNNRNEAEVDMCFICRDLLQNCDQLGIHLCDGGLNNERKMKGESSCDINARLEKMLEKIKDSLKDKHKDLSDAIEEQVKSRIREIEIIHKHAMDERSVLENLKKQLELRVAELEKKEKDFRDKEKQLEKEKTKFEDEMTKEKEEICRQWQQLRDEISRMEEMNEVQKGRIRLDVGGSNYTTSTLTLTQDPDSMLAAMFSGRHNIKIESDGTVFIDRDGTHFRYILNYLRDGCLKTDALPRNRQVLRELRNEAVYYQLHGLLQHIEKLM